MCGANTKPKCCNCGGEHSVAYWGCKVIKREVAVQQIRVKEKVSYAEAVKRTGREKVAEQGRGGREEIAESIAQQVEKMILEKMKRRLKRN